MPFSLHAAQLHHQIDTQLELAGLAACDAIRAMHEDLEKLHRARLVALLLAERLELAAQADLSDEGRARRRSTAGAGAGAWSIAIPARHSVTQPV